MIKLLLLSMLSCSNSYRKSVGSHLHSCLNVSLCLWFLRKRHESLVLLGKSARVVSNMCSAVTCSNTWSSWRETQEIQSLVRRLTGTRCLDPPFLRDHRRNDLLIRFHWAGGFCPMQILLVVSPLGKNPGSCIIGIHACSGQALHKRY